MISVSEANRELNGPFTGIEQSFDQLWNSAEAQDLRFAMKQKHPLPACRDGYEFNRDDPSIMIRLDFEYEE